VSDAADERERVQRAIVAQEALRETIGDEAVEFTLSVLRDRLAAIVSTDQRRRQATVLFADVTGFTSLAETLDAEIVTEIINEVWRRLDAVLRQHGAHIDKHIGDAVMALWGADASREGDPERAVRAAVELQRELTSFCHESGHAVRMRIGVTTGPVLFGAIGSTREFTAMGDTVNIASRLENAAPVGGVLVSHDTYRHIRGVFDVTPLNPIHVKGKSEPLRVYVVHAAKSRSFRMPTRGVEGVETRMVGRDVELSILEREYHEVAARSAARVVTVVGEAGVGKSRLLYEFENWLDLMPDVVYFMKARALEIRQDLPYGVFRDLFASRFEIRDSDSADEVAQKLTDGFGTDVGAVRAAQIGHWLGFDLPNTSTESALRASADLTAICSAHLTSHLRAVTAANPAVIIVEDLHWADDDSIALLERLVWLLADCRLLVVAAARPSVDERRPGWPGPPGDRRLGLDRLSERATRELVDEVLQCVDEVPTALVDLIIDRTDGNPFFVEEVVKMLIDDGAIVVDPDSTHWQVSLERLGRSSVPATLTGVLEARLDGLPDGTRLAVQRASVVGRVFWDEVVAAMADGETAAGAVEQLAVAVARELVYRRPHSSLESAVEFIFKHALLRDVAYETVLLRDRRALHMVAAEWLTDHAGARSSELTEMIAEHYRLAGLLDAAAQLHFLAGERSLRAGRALAAHRSIERAVGLWHQEGIDPLPRALICLAEASCRLGRLDEAEALVTPLLESDIDSDTMAWALFLASWVAADRHGPDAERAFLDRALPLAEQVGGDVLVRVLIGLTWSEVASERLAVAEVLATRAIELAQGGGESAGLCRALWAMAVVQDTSGRLDDARVSFHRALEIARRIGDLEAEARALGFLGVTHHLRGDEDGSLDEYAMAADYYQSELAIDSRLGTAVPQLAVMLNLAQVLARLDDLDAARSALRRAIDGALSLDLDVYLQYSLVVGADLLGEAGDVEDALGLLRRVLSSDKLTWDYRRDAERVVARIRRAADPQAVDHGLRPWDGDPWDVRELAADLADRLSSPPE
jgi:class 3 adenylate cyclase/tetratricopeptide (TPR) repeat protein